MKYYQMYTIRGRYCGVVGVTEVIWYCKHRRGRYIYRHFRTT